MLRVKTGFQVFCNIQEVSETEGRTLPWSGSLPTFVTVTKLRRDGVFPLLRHASQLIYQRLWIDLNVCGDERNP